MRRTSCRSCADALVVGDEVGDDGLVAGLGGDLDALDEQADEPPGEALDLAPHGGEQAERCPAREQTNSRILHGCFPRIQLLGQREEHAGSLREEGRV